MINRLSTHCGDDTCPAAAIAGNTIYLAHHAGGFEKDDIKHQMRAGFLSMKSTLESAGATLSDLVQIHLYLKDIKDFRAARDVFFEFFTDGFPARMSSTTDFVDPACLCMMDGIAYKKLD